VRNELALARPNERLRIPFPPAYVAAGNILPDWDRRVRLDTLPGPESLVWTYVYCDATLHRVSASTQMPPRGNARAYASGPLREQEEPAPGPDAICLAVVIEDGGGRTPRATRSLRLSADRWARFQARDGGSLV
jgi:hypothetical protein